MKFMNYQWILTLQYNINKKSFFFKLCCFIILKTSFTDHYLQKWKNISPVIRSKVYNVDGSVIIYGVQMSTLKGKKNNHFLLVTQKYDVKTYRFQYIICDWYVLKISVNFPTRGAKNRSKWFEFNREWSVFILNSILYLFFVCHQF